MRNLILAHSKENREKLPCRRIFGLKLDLRGVWWVRWQNRALARGRKGGRSGADRRDRHRRGARLCETSAMRCAGWDWRQSRFDLFRLPVYCGGEDEVKIQPGMEIAG